MDRHEYIESLRKHAEEMKITAEQIIKDDRQR